MLQHALQRELYLKVHRGDGSNPGWYNSLVQSIVVGVRNDQILEVTALKFKSVSLLGLVVIYNYPEEESTLSRAYHTWEDCCYNWTELNTDNGEIGQRSRGFFFWVGYKKLFFPPYFALLPSPRCITCVCNTLQHTATHCNTLQHTWTHRCNTLQQTATWSLFQNALLVCVRSLVLHDACASDSFHFNFMTSVLFCSVLQCVAYVWSNEYYTCAERRRYFIIIVLRSLNQTQGRKCHHIDTKNHRQCKGRKNTVLHHDSDNRDDSQVSAT